MMEGRPRDDDIEEWYSAASRCDENRTANAAFHSSSRSTSYACSLMIQVRFPVSLAHQTVTKNRFAPLTCNPDFENESLSTSVESETVLDVPKLTLPN